MVQWVHVALLLPTCNRLQVSLERAVHLPGMTCNALRVRAPACVMRAQCVALRVRLRNCKCSRLLRSRPLTAPLPYVDASTVTAYAAWCHAAPSCSIRINVQPPPTRNSTCCVPMPLLHVHVHVTVRALDGHLRRSRSLNTNAFRPSPAASHNPAIHRPSESISPAYRYMRPPA